MEAPDREPPLAVVPIIVSLTHFFTEKASRCSRVNASWLNRLGPISHHTAESVGEVIGIAVAYVVAISLAAFLTFAIDKRRARLKQWRIPERWLLILAALGGTVGAVIAARTLRHKTFKEPFRTILWTIGFIQLAILGLLFVPQVRDAIGHAVLQVLQV